MSGVLDSSERTVISNAHNTLNTNPACSCPSRMKRIETSDSSRPMGLRFFIPATTTLMQDLTVVHVLGVHGRGPLGPLLHTSQGLNIQYGLLKFPSIFMTALWNMGLRISSGDLRKTPESGRRRFPT